MTSWGLFYTLRMSARTLRQRLPHSTHASQHSCCSWKLLSKSAGVQRHHLHQRVPPPPAQCSSGSRTCLHTRLLPSNVGRRQIRQQFSTVASAYERREMPSWAGTDAGGPGRLVLIDALALMFRVHFGYKPAGLGANPLTASAGEDTTIVHELYSDYKAQRPKMPHEIGDAMPRVLDVLDVMGIPVLSVPGVEADDVIGTLAVRAVDAGMQAVIVSADKDFYQLLRPGLQILRPPKKTEKPLVSSFVPYNEASFEAEYAVTPAQWPDVKALAGDPSDNIPGVKGIGNVLAPKLIAQMGSLENLLAHPEEVTRKAVREKLMLPEEASAARLALRLVTIQSDLDVPPLRKPLEELRLQVPGAEQRKEAAMLFAELDFTKIPGQMDQIWKTMAHASKQLVA